MPNPFPRHRPPWWPENEAWPPQRPPWQHGRGWFFWRVAGVFAFLFVLTVGSCLLAFWLAVIGLGWLDPPTMMGGGPHMGPNWIGIGWWRAFGIFFSGLILLGLVLVIVSGYRRVAAPVGEVMEAAQRVEAGDYTARVVERGPNDVRALARAFNAMTARLQLSEEQRRRLLADVTHELRTPLAVVQGNLEALLDGVYPADETHLAPILEETRVLARLVDDLRTLSLAESGVLKLQREPTDLAILITEAVASFRASAQAAGITLRTEIADDLPLVEIDPARLREVLSNLTANALRYTPPGGIVTVSAALDRAAARLAITVADTGQGIAPEALPHIFDRFYKSEDSRGSGLGLAIAKNLVAAHGGEISAASEPGKGTTIRVTLPLEEGKS